MGLSHRQYLPRQQQQHNYKLISINSCFSLILSLSILSTILLCGILPTSTIQYANARYFSKPTDGSPQNWLGALTSTLNQDDGFKISSSSQLTSFNYVAMGDFNCDGFDDVFVADYSSPNNFLIYGTGASNVDFSSILTSPAPAMGVTFEGVNYLAPHFSPKDQNGCQNLYLGASIGFVYIVKSRPKAPGQVYTPADASINLKTASNVDGVYNKITGTAGYAIGNQIEFLDLDQDGKLDVVISESGTIRIYLDINSQFDKEDPFLNLQPSFTISSPSYVVRAIYTGDFNNDNDGLTDFGVQLEDGIYYFYSDPYWGSQIGLEGFPTTFTNLKAGLKNGNVSLVTYVDYSRPFVASRQSVTAIDFDQDGKTDSFIGAVYSKSNVPDEDVSMGVFSHNNDATVTPISKIFGSSDESTLSFGWTTVSGYIGAKGHQIPLVLAGQPYAPNNVGQLFGFYGHENFLPNNFDATTMNNPSSFDNQCTGFILNRPTGQTDQRLGLSVSVGDFNGDSRLDFAVASIRSFYMIFGKDIHPILSGNDGNTKIDYIIPSSPSSSSSSAEIMKLFGAETKLTTEFVDSVTVTVENAKQGDLLSLLGSVEIPDSLDVKYDEATFTYTFSAKKVDGIAYIGINQDDITQALKAICFSTTSLIDGKRKIVYNWSHINFPSKQFEPILAVEIDVYNTPTIAGSLTDNNVIVSPDDTSIDVVIDDKIVITSLSSNISSATVTISNYQSLDIGNVKIKLKCWDNSDDNLGDLVCQEFDDSEGSLTIRPSAGATSPVDVEKYQKLLNTIMVTTTDRYSIETVDVDGIELEIGFSVSTQFETSNVFKRNVIITQSYDDLINIEPTLIIDTCQVFTGITPFVDIVFNHKDFSLKSFEININPTTDMVLSIPTDLVDANDTIDITGDQTGSLFITGIDSGNFKIEILDTLVNAIKLTGTKPLPHEVFLELKAIRVDSAGVTVPIIKTMTFTKPIITTKVPSFVVNVATAVHDTDNNHNNSNTFTITSQPITLSSLFSLPPPSSSLPTDLTQYSYSILYADSTQTTIPDYIQFDPTTQIFTVTTTLSSSKTTTMTAIETLLETQYKLVITDGCGTMAEIEFNIKDDDDVISINHSSRLMLSITIVIITIITALISLV